VIIAVGVQTARFFTRRLAAFTAAARIITVTVTSALEAKFAALVADSCALFRTTPVDTIFAVAEIRRFRADQTIVTVGIPISARATVTFVLPAAANEKGESQQGRAGRDSNGGKDHGRGLAPLFPGLNGSGEKLHIFGRAGQGKHN
jgi:hypothetical protein